MVYIYQFYYIIIVIFELSAAISLVTLSYNRTHILVINPFQMSYVVNSVFFPNNGCKEHI